MITPEQLVWLREQIAETEKDVREGPEWPLWAILPSRMAARIADVLAQCEAHTAVLDHYERAEQGMHSPDAYELADGLVLAVALAYRHRPGYHAQWPA
ncbi:DUF6221 family protein [Saccharothrix xinjiangensis]|uniref:DUF6221 family protein n=1 Tax=Saccharothrix xinjiangensis TaxID=204798 RepID=A0ABV9XU33_9PSEU